MNLNLFLEKSHVSTVFPDACLFVHVPSLQEPYSSITFPQNTRQMLLLVLESKNETFQNCTNIITAITSDVIPQFSVDINFALIHGSISYGINYGHSFSMFRSNVQFFRYNKYKFVSVPGKNEIIKINFHTDISIGYDFKICWLTEHYNKHKHFLSMAPDNCTLKINIQKRSLTLDMLQAPIGANHIL